jgi:diguanylate cyclase (GGDEF)-like protein
MDRQILERLRETGRLPSPKGVYLEVARLIDAQQTTSREVARVIQSDPALAGKLLRLANIAIHFERRPIASVGEAILILGFAQVKRLVLALSLMNDQVRSCPTFDYGSFWTHSLLAGMAAQRLSKLLGTVLPPDEAFTAGLLGQVGRLALASIYPQDYGRLLSAAEAADLHWLRAEERARLGVDHGELSAILLGDWGLPQLYVDAVYFKGASPSGTYLPDARSIAAAQTLYLADLVGGLCLCETQNRPEQEAAAVVLAGHLGVSKESLFILGNELLQDWGEWSKILGEPVLVQPPFPTGLVSAMTKEEPLPEGEAPSSLLRLLVVGTPRERGRSLPEGLIRSGHVVSMVQADLRPVSPDPVQPAQMVIIEWSLPDAPCRDYCTALRAAAWVEPPYLLGIGPTLDDGQLRAAFRAGLDAYEVAPISEQILDAHLRMVQRLQGAQREFGRKWQKLHRYATTLAHSNRELRQSALTDPLTGLRNRRYATERLQQEWAVAERHGGELAIMLLDLDQFKQINDDFGHDVGDEVLRQFTAALGGLARQQDVLCRIGGDEFLVICPDTSPDGAKFLGARICESMDLVPLPPVARGRLHVSVGIASLKDGVQDVEALLRAADLALYTAKQGGRNRVVIYGEIQ